jgi:hypothetical protein
MPFSRACFDFSFDFSGQTVSSGIKYASVNKIDERNRDGPISEEEMRFL